jgi:hypothetical protein
MSSIIAGYCGGGDCRRAVVVPGEMTRKPRIRVMQVKAGSCGFINGWLLAGL